MRLTTVAYWGTLDDLKLQGVPKTPLKFVTKAFSSFKTFGEFAQFGMDRFKISLTGPFREDRGGLSLGPGEYFPPYFPEQVTIQVISGNGHVFTILVRGEK